MLGFCQNCKGTPTHVNVLVLPIFAPDSALVRAGAGICGACPTKPYGGSNHAGDYGCPVGDGHAVLLLFHPQGNCVQYKLLNNYFFSTYYFDFVR